VIIAAISIFLIYIYDALPAPITVFNVEPDEFTMSKVEELFNIFPVTASEEPVVITVPVSLGSVIVLAVVGSATVNVVSLPSSVAPSKIIVPSSVMAKDEPVIAAKVPAAAELAPIVVPSIAPALISTVARVAVPVVEIFSLPKLIEPELSVIEPAASANVPAFTVVDVSVVIVAEVCVPATTPLILGADNDTTVADALIPLLMELPLPRAVYNSTKLALTLVAPSLSVSPLPSLATAPKPID